MASNGFSRMGRFHCYARLFEGQGKGSQIEFSLRAKALMRVTTLGLFYFDKAAEMVLKAYNPLASVQEIKENVQVLEFPPPKNCGFGAIGWNLKRCT
jgi:hypothetical protein